MEKWLKGIDNNLERNLEVLIEKSENLLRNPKTDKTKCDRVYLCLNQLKKSIDTEDPVLFQKCYHHLVSETQPQNREDFKDFKIEINPDYFRESIKSQWLEKLNEMNRR